MRGCPVFVKLILTHWPIITSRICSLWYLHDLWTHSLFISCFWWTSATSVGFHYHVHEPMWLSGNLTLRTYVPQLYSACLRSRLYCPTIILLSIITLMENKRDASMAGLHWPTPSIREAPSSGTSSTSPTPNPTTLPPSTSETPSPIPPTTTTNPPTTPAPYIPSNPVETPFPQAEHLHYDVYAHPRHFERIVHQIHFKIYTRANNEKSLYIEEIPVSGIPRCRDPEHFFYGLSSNWDWACHTADYWRHFFNVPLVHGHHPYTPIDIVPPPTSNPPPPTTDLATQARQLEDSWRAALALGELQQGSHMLNNMPFIDALRALGQREQQSETIS